MVEAEAWPPSGVFPPLTCSLESRDVRWGTVGAEGGSWSTHSSRLSARARAMGASQPGTLAGATLQKTTEINAYKDILC